MKKLRLNALRAPLTLRRWATWTSLLAPGLALGNPLGGTVVAGSASISLPDANTTRIEQLSQSAIINWQEFGIGEQQLVQFLQPSASSAVLNRVVGGNPSEILGNLSANGRVFLINPQGVLFGAGSRIDVGSLYAGTADIADQDFLAGRYLFVDGTDAAVMNQGSIHAADGGFVVLLGESVGNTGLIRAQAGDVVLAAGRALDLDLSGDGLVRVTVTAEALTEAAGVENSGQLLADGGRIELTARAAQGLASVAVNNRGLIRAQSIQEQAGEIYLSGAGADVLNNGELDVSAQDAVSDGGQLDILSDGDIRLQEASILLASGRNGGQLRLIAEGTLGLDPRNRIDGRATQALGDGAFLELSGHEGLQVRGDLLLGRGGQLLVDPSRITVANGAGQDTGGDDQTVYEQTIENLLAEGTDVSLIATETITLNDLADGLLDGRGTEGNGGSLLLGIGNSDNGYFSRGSSGNILFGDLNDGIAVDTQLSLYSGSESGEILVGSLRAGNLDVSTGTTLRTSGILSHGGVSLARSGTTSTAGLFELTGDVVAETGFINVYAYGAELRGQRLEARQGQLYLYSDLGISSQDLIGTSLNVNVNAGDLITGNLSALSGSVYAYAGHGAMRLGNVSAATTNDQYYGGSARIDLTADGDLLTGLLGTRAEVDARGAGYNAYADGSIYLNSTHGALRTGNISAQATARGDYYTSANAGISLFASSPHGDGLGGIQTGDIAASATASTTDQGDSLGGYDGYYQATAYAQVYGYTAGYQTPALDAMGTLGSSGDGDGSALALATGAISTLTEAQSLDGGLNIGGVNRHGYVDLSGSGGQVSLGSVSSQDYITLRSYGYYDVGLNNPETGYYSFRRAGDINTGDLAVLGGNIYLDGEANVSLGTVSGGPGMSDQIDRLNLYADGALISPWLSSGYTGSLLAGQIDIYSGATLDAPGLNLNSNRDGIQVTVANGALLLGSISADDGDIDQGYGANVSLDAEGDLVVGNVSAHAEHLDPDGSSAYYYYYYDATARISLHSSRGSIRTGNLTSYAYDQSPYSTYADARINLRADAPASVGGGIFTGDILAQAFAETSDQGDTLSESDNYFYATAYADITAQAGNYYYEYNTDAPASAGAASLQLGDVRSLSQALTLDGGTNIGTAYQTGNINLGTYGGSLSTGAIHALSALSLYSYRFTSYRDYNPDTGVYETIEDIPAGDISTGPILIDEGALSIYSDAGLNFQFTGDLVAEYIQLQSQNGLQAPEVNLWATDGGVYVYTQGDIRLGNINTHSVGDDGYYSYSADVDLYSGLGGIEVGNISSHAESLDSNDYYGYYNSARISISAYGGNLRTGTLDSYAASFQGDYSTYAYADISLYSRASDDPAAQAGIETGAINANAFAHTGDQGDTTLGTDSYFSAYASATVYIGSDAYYQTVYDETTGLYTDLHQPGGGIHTGDILSMAEAVSLDSGEFIGGASHSGQIGLYSVGGTLDTGSITALSGGVALDTYGLSYYDGSGYVYLPGGDISTGPLSATEGSIDLHSDGGMSLSEVRGPSVFLSAAGSIRGSQQLFVETSVGDLFLSALDATAPRVELHAAGALTALAHLSATEGNLILSSGIGNLTLGDLSGANLDLSAESLSVGNVAVTGDLRLTATSGDLRGGVLTAGGLLSLNAAGNVYLGGVTANEVSLSAGLNLDVGEVSAVGLASLQSSNGFVGIDEAVAGSLSLRSAVQIEGSDHDAVRLVANSGGISIEAPRIAASQIELLSVGVLSLSSTMLDSGGFGTITLLTGGDLDLSTVATSINTGNLSAAASNLSLGDLNLSGELELRAINSITAGHLSASSISLEGSRITTGDISAQHLIHVGGAYQLQEPLGVEGPIFLLAAGPAAEVRLGNLSADQILVGEFLEGPGDGDLSTFSTRAVEVGLVNARYFASLRALDNLSASAITVSEGDILLRGAGIVTVTGDILASGTVDVGGRYENRYDPASFELIEQSLGDPLSSFVVGGGIYGSDIYLGSPATDFGGNHSLLSFSVSGPVSAGNDLAIATRDSLSGLLLSAGHDLRLASAGTISLNSLYAGNLAWLGGDSGIVIGDATVEATSLEMLSGAGGILIDHSQVQVQGLTATAGGSEGGIRIVNGSNLGYEQAVFTSSVSSADVQISDSRIAGDRHELHSGRDIVLQSVDNGFGHDDGSASTSVLLDAPLGRLLSENTAINTLALTVNRASDDFAPIGFTSLGSDSAPLTLNFTGIFSLADGGELRGTTVQLTAGTINLSGVAVFAPTINLNSGGALSIANGSFTGDSIALIAGGLLSIDGTSFSNNAGEIMLSAASASISNAGFGAGSISLSFSDGASIGDSLFTVFASSGTAAQDAQATVGGPSLRIDGGNGSLSVSNSQFDAAEIVLTASQLSIIGGGSRSSQFNASASGAMSLSGVLLDSRDGGIRLETGDGALLVGDGSQLYANQIQLLSGNSLRLGNVQLDTSLVASTDKATGVEDIVLDGQGLVIENADLRGGNITINGHQGELDIAASNLLGRIISIESATIRTISASTIDAAALGVRADSADFELATLTIGEDLSPFVTDSSLLDALAASSHSDLLPSSRTPNASFEIGTTLALGQVEGTAHHLFLLAPTIQFAARIQGADDLFLHYVQPLHGVVTGISSFDFAAGARSLAIGTTAYDGNIQIGAGENTEVFAGDTNLIFLTQGKIAGLENLSGNGRVVVLGGMIETPEPEVPPAVEEQAETESSAVSREVAQSLAPIQGQSSPEQTRREEEEEEREQESESAKQDEVAAQTPPPGSVSSGAADQAAQQCQAVN